MTFLAINGHKVRVTSRRQKASPWQLDMDTAGYQAEEAVVFVDLTGDMPDFYIAPAQWVRDDVRDAHEAWLATQPGGVRPRNPISPHHAVPLERIEQWHQRWDVITG